MILHPAETQQEVQLCRQSQQEVIFADKSLGRKQEIVDSLSRKPVFFAEHSLGRKKEIVGSLGRNQI